MSNSASVNDVITDSVTQSSTLLTGFAAPQGMAMVDVVAAETIGMAMHNAVMAQQNAQLTSNASVVSTCAKMIAVERVLAPPAPTPKNDNPPPFMHLSGSGGSAFSAIDATALLNTATTLAENAINEVNKQKSEDETADKKTETNLTQLIEKLTNLQKEIKPPSPP